MIGLLLLSLGLISFTSAYSAEYLSQDEETKPGRSFIVDYTNNRFLKDGSPHRYVAGEMHYFRIPRPYWRDRLKKLKAVGANTVQTYIEWSSHEQSPRNFNFTGDNDVVEYIKMAQEEGLDVIIRPGPYICAEREFGGFPAWLLQINPKMKLRSSDPSFTYFVARWFKTLLPKLVPLLYGNGGPIIMVQIENEYGSYPYIDVKYKNWLRDFLRGYVQDSAVLFTTDGFGLSYIQGGAIDGVFITVDFGAGGKDIGRDFAPLRSAQPNGPLVNSEFYVGWLSYWGYPFATVPTETILTTMEAMLQNESVSFSMYMFHGGTNFGFRSGSETHKVPGSGSAQYFQADLTSYDYDAPVTEAGDLTDKYFAIQELLAQYNFTTQKMTAKQHKISTDEIELKPIVNLFDVPSVTVQSKTPLTFEQLSQTYGFVSYETILMSPNMDPSVLQVNLRDRGIVYLNNEEVSTLMYTVINETPLPPSAHQNQSLRILVENMGRRNYQMMTDCTKGIISNATIDGEIVNYWNITGYPFDEAFMRQIEMMEETEEVKLPGFYRAQFQLEEDEKTYDTYLDMSGWGKGVAFINGFNLGRYWHIGPQMTLYVPGCYLKPYPKNNTLIIFELHYTNPTESIRFTDTPILNSTIQGYQKRIISPEFKLI